MTDLISADSLLASTTPILQVEDGPMASVELTDRYGFQPVEFYVWDYDRRLVSQYEREGECNGCGDCCTATIAVQSVPLEPTVDAGPVMGRWSGQGTDGKGVWGEAVNGDRAYFAKTVTMGPAGTHRCKQLLDGNRCAIQALKPTLCKVWPFMPSQVEAYPNCSYKFKRTHVWKLDATWAVGDEVSALDLIEATPGPAIVEHGG